MGKKMKIFLSCGQKNDEKKDGLKISNYFNQKYKNQLEMLFAEEIFDSNGLTEIIYKNLRDCDAFIGIFHKREKINKNFHRSSLFVNQELAIASYLKKGYFRTYSKGDIKLEGVNKYLMNRNIEFKTAVDIMGLSNLSKYDLTEILYFHSQNYRKPTSNVKFALKVIEKHNQMYFLRKLSLIFQMQDI